MLNLPEITHITGNPGNSKEDAAWCRHALSNFATEVMNFMAALGSHVSLLRINPTLKPDLRLVADGDGQTWPAYAYQAHWTTNAHGLETVVACPLLEPGKEYPELKYLL
jgi:hypothetical protein